MAPRIICFIAAAAFSAAASALPDRFHADYSLAARGMIVGHARLSLSPLGDGRYVYRSQSTSSGLAAMVRDETVTERSEWRFHRSGLQPLHYRYLRRGRDEREVAVEFDWERGIARNTAMGHTWQMRIPDGTVDKLSYMLALMIDLAAGKHSVEYRIADGGRLKRYELTRLRDEALDTALGVIDTVVVLRRRDDNERQTTLWCAPALHYLPVKVVHHEHGGDVLSVTIDAVEGMETPRGTGSKSGWGHQWERLQPRTASRLAP